MNNENKNENQEHDQAAADVTAFALEQLASAEADKISSQFSDDLALQREVTETSRLGGLIEHANSIGLPTDITGLKQKMQEALASEADGQVTLSSKVPVTSSNSDRWSGRWLLAVAATTLLVAGGGYMLMTSNPPREVASHFAESEQLADEAKGDSSNVINLNPPAIIFGTDGSNKQPNANELTPAQRDQAEEGFGVVKEARLDDALEAVTDQVPTLRAKLGKAESSTVLPGGLGFSGDVILKEKGDKIIGGSVDRSVTDLLGLVDEQKAAQSQVSGAGQEGDFAAKAEGQDHDINNIKYKHNGSGANGSLKEYSPKWDGKSQPDDVSSFGGTSVVGRLPGDPGYQTWGPRTNVPANLDIPLTQGSFGGDFAAAAQDKAEGVDVGGQSGAQIEGRGIPALTDLPLGGVAFSRLESGANGSLDSKAPTWTIPDQVTSFGGTSVIGRLPGDPGITVPSNLDIPLTQSSFGQTVPRTEELQPMLDEFNKLVGEEKFAEAAFLARQANEIAPKNPVSEVMQEKIALSKSAAEFERLKGLREEGFVRGMNDAETVSVDSLLGFDDADWDKMARDAGLGVVATEKELVVWAAVRNQKIEASFSRTPLSEVVEILAERCGFEIVVDAKSLESQNVTLDAPVTMSFSQPISVESVLNLVLANQGLGFKIEGEKVVVTPRDESKMQGQAYGLSTAKGLMSILQSRKARLSIKFGDSHPDVVSNERQINSLRRYIAVCTSAPAFYYNDYKERDPSSNEQYELPPENKFQQPLGEAARSTFSIDVDTASYSNARRFLTNRQLPPANSVRVEEFVNYFKYDYAQPTDGKPFAVNMEVAGCPWNETHKLLRVGIKGKEIPQDDRPASNLVFLIDVSGSMSDRNKLPLLQRSMLMLVDKLTENDKVTIVTYAGNAGLRLEPTSGDQKDKIRQIIQGLSSGGSTHGSAGIRMAYDLAAKNFIEEGTNRVILATDGDLNVGVTADNDLVQLISDKAELGVFLSVLGFGTGNLKDAKLEKLADNGNGQYSYIDSIREARKVLVEEMTGSLITIAKDVKIQLEFNPGLISSYRLIGYENRVLQNQDFDNDQVDAGEIGAGHTVTAIYELVPVGSEDAVIEEDDQDAPLKYQRRSAAKRSDDSEANDKETEQDSAASSNQAYELTDAAKSGELLTLALRYKEPLEDVSTRIEFIVQDSDRSFDEASSDFRFAASVASFGMLLRHSRNAGDWRLGDVENSAAAALGEDDRGHRAEFIDLVRQTKAIVGH